MQEESAPVGLDWLPPSFGHILKRVDLRKIMIDLAVLLQTPWFSRKCWYLETGGGGWKQATAACSSQWPGICVFQTNWHMWEAEVAILCCSEAHDY